MEVVVANPIAVEVVGWWPSLGALSSADNENVAVHVDENLSSSSVYSELEEEQEAVDSLSTTLQLDVMVLLSSSPLSFSNDGTSTKKQLFIKWWLREKQQALTLRKE